jgi:hypothetical protein
MCKEREKVAHARRRGKDVEANLGPCGLRTWVSNDQNLVVLGLAVGGIRLWAKRGEEGQNGDEEGSSVFV